MRKWIYVLILTLVFSTSVCVTSEGTALGTIDYQDTQTFFIASVVNLTLHSSPTGNEDVIINSHVHGESFTVISVTSQSISIDYTFVNDIKPYTFIDNTTSDLYVVNVDYSMVDVPENLLELLNTTIASQLILIESLTNNIIELNNNISFLMNDNIAKKLEINALLINMSHLKNETELIRQNVSMLKFQVYSTEGDVTHYKDLHDNDTVKMEMYKGIFDEKDKKIEDVTSPLAFIFEHKGITSVILNIPSIIIGVFITILVLYFVWDYVKKYDFGGRSARSKLRKTRIATNFLKRRIVGTDDLKKKYPPRIDKIIGEHDDKELKEDPKTPPEDKKPTDPTPEPPEKQPDEKLSAIYRELDVMVQ